MAISPAHALSEIKREDLPSPATPPIDDDMAPPGSAVPMPDPPGTTPPAASPATPSGEPEKTDPEGPTNDGGMANPRADPDAPLPEVVYDLGKLPEPVRRMHDLIVEACKSGDIEKLRPLIGTGDAMTQLSLSEIDGDPIAFLKGLSGDTEGQEILAIMEEVLNAGYVHVDVGTPQELYVWPYFFALPLDKLDARQRVELFKIVTAGDYDGMKQFGAYIFYRIGITPAGQWTFFVAGD
ncbi:alanine and proline-rich secreted protein Apa [Mesorhizobium sp. YC-39]|uniref:alanine and proline-rich secreted protein Apa n=1 Tax=unclassified Mesorhizobium TaxID=325217 RepID=UPI0021E6DECB|nr:MULTISPECIES: alanine and proline-rich secreted protein Apa [unclassified Mesorhizobium]MCV3210360.1 alanine and proline-rich secreted protein Apa [Mesorhizobium sp. YC-2]MCV3230890.1 alanine and proline-rich secreted protein Apa [Mesorhizobium sp. YC-39]